MKKILLCILIIIFITIPTTAKENRLNIVEKNDQVYYESKLFNEEYFLNYTNMLPGKVFIDELIIKNDTKNSYKIYLEITCPSQNTLSKQLLENININITLDNKEIYNGNLSDEYNQFNDAILLGEFASKKEAKLLVNTELSKEYTNTNNTEESYVNWRFLIQKGSTPPTEIVQAPNTMINTFPTLIIISGILTLIGIGTIIYGKITAK